MLAQQLVVYQSPFAFAIGEVITPTDFLAFFIISSIIVVVVQNIRHAHIFYRFLFYTSVFVGTLMVFASVFPVTVSLPVSALFVIGLILVPVVWLHNLVVIVASIGIGAVIGVESQWPTVAGLMALLSVYDVIAVYVTKHMVDVAHNMLKARAIFALIVPDDRRDFRALISRVSPGAGFVILGGGDVIFPMILACSVFAVSPIAANGVVIGSTIGLMVNNILLRATKRALPALPLIAIGAVLGLMIGLNLLAR